MPLYEYKHECGFGQRLYLKENVDSKVLNCFRCGRKVTAKQVRDPKLAIKEVDGVVGVLEKEPPKYPPRRR